MRIQGIWVVSALGRFDPGRFGLCRFDHFYGGSFRPWLVDRFGPFSRGNTEMRNQADFAKLTLNSEINLKYVLFSKSS